MKLLILSDLHLEFGEPYTLPSGLDFDAAIMAGDISCPGSKAVHWARRESTFGAKPVLIVAGNHEFYGREMTMELEEMKAERWVTVLLDLDEVMCVDQPFSAAALHKALELGEELDQQLLDLLFTPTARDVLLRVQEQMGRPIRYAISSSWRNHFSREQLELIFRSAGLSFVADNLHEGAAWKCYQSSFQPDRQIDIECWIEQFHHGEPFVVLDDKHSGGSLAFNQHFPRHPLFARVALCTPGVGLTMDHVDVILAALRRPT